MAGRALPKNRFSLLASLAPEESFSSTTNLQRCGAQASPFLTPETPPLEGTCVAATDPLSPFILSGAPLRVAEKALQPNFSGCGRLADAEITQAQGGLFGLAPLNLYPLITVPTTFSNHPPLLIRLPKPSLGWGFTPNACDFTTQLTLLRVAAPL
jgi:hypothetical protein